MNTSVTTPARRRICVASVYGPSPWNRQWLALQRDFLERCGEGAQIEFGLFLNGVELDVAGTQAVVIGDSAENLGHAEALRASLEYFRTRWRGADGYLLLDSDCFPIQPGWARELPSLMERHGKAFAAPMRFENLEAYPHPSALYIDGRALDDPRLRFDGSASATNLLGERVRDIGAGLLELGNDLLPLVRSNVRNPHPIAAAVYNHLFYHHGAGSRHFGFRAINRGGYYAHWHQESTSAEADALRESLFADPQRFIEDLTG